MQLARITCVVFYRSKHRVGDCTYGRKAVIGKT